MATESTNLFSEKNFSNIKIPCYSKEKPYWRQMRRTNPYPQKSPKNQAFWRMAPYFANFRQLERPDFSSYNQLRN